MLGLDRSLDQDVAYGLRLLVDIAERSLADSPFLDPTTAVQALDRLHDCLRQLAPRPFPSGHLVDDDGRERVVVPVMSWDDYVRLAFQEIRLAGAGSPQVARRLRDVINDLLTVAPPDRRPVLQHELELLDASVRDRYGDPSDVSRRSPQTGKASASASHRVLTTDEADPRAASGAGVTGTPPARSHGFLFSGEGQTASRRAQQGEGCVWIRRLCSPFTTMPLAMAQ